MHTRLHDLLQAMSKKKRTVVTSKVQRGSSPDLIAGKPASMEVRTIMARTVKMTMTPTVAADSNCTHT